VSDGYQQVWPSDFVISALRINVGCPELYGSFPEPVLEDSVQDTEVMGRVGADATNEPNISVSAPYLLSCGVWCRVLEDGIPWLGRH
jgi:hypothetical protein